MLMIRLVETAVADDFRENKIFSFLHLSIGQEASAVGVAMALRQDDRVFGNHRSHGHYLAKGGDLYRMLCEIYGKQDGCCGGYGGSMHCLDRTAGFMGTTPILGSIAPIATGSAFQQKVTGCPRITVVFVGDGASEEGGFYESINLAAVMRLPIIYVIENNLYAVNTPLSARRSEVFSWKSVASGIGLEYFKVNGNSFSDTYLAAENARKSAAKGNPVIMHATVFRHMAHSGPIRDESVRIIDTQEIRTATDCVKDIIEQLHDRIDICSIESMRIAVDSSVKQTFERVKKAL